VDEALAGTKGELAIKLYGPDFFVMDTKAKEIANVLRGVRGVADLDYDHAPGQPQLQIIVDRAAAARYGINVSDVQDVVDLALGGSPISAVFEGERRFDIAARLAPDARADAVALGHMMIATRNGGRVPLSQLASIRDSDGATIIARRENERQITVRTNIRGRDQGGPARSARNAAASSPNSAKNRRQLSSTDAGSSR